MPAKMPIDPELRKRALAIYQEQGPAEAARQTGIKRGTISEWARRAGVTVTRRARTQEAVAMARLTMEQRRVKLADDLLADAERLRTQLWEPAEVHHWGPESERDGNIVTTRTVFLKETIDQPVFGDQRSIMQAAQIAIDKSQLLSGEATSRPEQLSPEQARERLKAVIGRAKLHVVRSEAS